MITGYELHIETTKSLMDMVEDFRAKGVAVDYKLCTDGHGMLYIKHPQKSHIYKYKIKLNKEMEGTYCYEIMSWSKDCFDLSIEWFKDM